MKTPNFFSDTRPIIDLIVEDTGLHPDIVRTVLQSQTDILLEEVCIKGHIVNLCGLGSVGIYDCGEDIGLLTDKDKGKRGRYRIKFTPTQPVRKVVRSFNINGASDGFICSKGEKRNDVNNLVNTVMRYYGKVKSEK